jgi:hypothetical protein
LVALVAALFLVGGLLSYAGIQYQPLSGPERPMAGGVASDVAGDAVVRIDLPFDDCPNPPGPHRDRFEANCKVCHSARLVFTQPRLPEKKWQDVVRKMVAAYGAPLSPDEEREIVSYLLAVHGPPPAP